jgi:glycosyltransferase involved in cell wall biosynthesis
MNSAIMSTPSSRTTSSQSVLIVEEHAHWRAGHFPVRFAQLAEGYAELGFRVEVLTSSGWSAERATDDAPFVLHRYGWVATQCRRVADRLRRSATNSALGRVARRAGDVIGMLALSVATRARRRRMSPVPVATVILGYTHEPNLVAATVGPGRFLLNQFRAPDEITRWDNRLVVRILGRAACIAERRRRSAGGRFRIAAADATWAGVWAQHAPCLDPIVLAIAGVRILPRVPDSRRALGLDAGAKIALCFGHEDSKLPQTAIEALTGLDDWMLVIAGRSAENIDNRNTDARRLVLFPGHVEDAVRDMLLSAADLMILSFVTGFRRNSGTLMDAISVGVPIVCTADTAPAALVRRYHLGELFTAGDAASLADAVRRAPRHIDPDDLARARSECSNRVIAREQLRALDQAAPG